MLAQYRVLDLTDEKGFYGGQLLGSLGADIIKIKRPDGDPARNIGPFFQNIPDPEKIVESTDRNEPGNSSGNA